LDHLTSRGGGTPLNCGLVVLVLVVLVLVLRAVYFAVVVCRSED
jgi:hypothetical protein